MTVLDANLAVPFAIANQPFKYVTTIHGQFTNDTLFYIGDLTVGSRYTVRGFDGEAMLAAERGFYWRNELQWPVLQTGQRLYAGLDYGRVFGPNTACRRGDGNSWRCAVEVCWRVLRPFRGDAHLQT